MSDELDALDDAKLSEVFAVEVAGGYMGRGLKRGEYPDMVYFGDGVASVPTFATDANAVLPWLEKCVSFFHTFHGDGLHNVEIGRAGNPASYAEATTFPRAACIALIRAKRAQPS